MTDSITILVAILSSFLAIFLLIGIIALIKLVQLLDHLKNISEKAEKIANSAEHVGDFFKYSAGPAAIAKLLANISESVFKHNKRKDERSKE